MIIFSSDLFVWTGDKGVCDLTDLPVETLHTPEPILVKSSKTGKIVTFYFVTSLFAQSEFTDRELTGWRYVSGDGIELFIVND